MVLLENIFVTTKINNFKEKVNRKMNMGKKVIHTVHELRTIVNNRNIKQVKNKKKLLGKLYLCKFFDQIENIIWSNCEHYFIKLGTVFASKSQNSLGGWGALNMVS